MGVVKINHQGAWPNVPQWRSGLKLCNDYDAFIRGGQRPPLEHGYVIIGWWLGFGNFSGVRTTWIVSKLFLWVRDSNGQTYI